MSEKKRTIADDVTDGIRQVLEDLEQFINPEKRQKRAPVPVPVRVRPDQPDPRDPRNYPPRR